MTSIDSVPLQKNYKSFKCHKCHQIFNENISYQNHLQIHKKDNINAHCCNVCGKSFAVPARLTRHYRIHTGEKPYQCEYCNKSFSVKENLSVHRRIHTKERPYKCNICKSAFEHSGKLHRHMRIHTGERPHKCEQCNKTFIQSGQLVIHMRTHTGEKPYVCKSCEKGFTCSKQLKVHMRTHTGEKPYKCNICGKSFGYNHVLKFHQVAHYGEKFYKCILCQETFNSKKLMELHIQNHTDTLVNDYTTKNKLFLKPSQSISKILPTNNKDEIGSNLLLKSKSNQNEPEVATNQSHFTVTSNSQNLKYSDMQIISGIRNDQDVIFKNEILTHYIFTDLYLKKYYKTKNRHNEQTFNDHLCKLNLPAQDFWQRLKIDLQLVEEQKQHNSRGSTNEYISKVQHDMIDSSLFSRTLNIVIPNVKDNFSLPLRKRYRMILESMKIESPKLITTTKFTSVIKFANSNNTKLTYD